MNNIELWKMTVDLGLLASLVFFAFRFIKSQSPGINPAKLLELNAGLKAAIRQADEAGRTLNDQLLKRQQTLEKLLYDMETVEGRVNRAVTSAEERRGALDMEISRARGIYDNLLQQPSPHVAPAAAPVRPAVRQEALKQEVIQEPPPPAFETSVVSRAAASSRTNIFGEEIIEEVPAAAVQPRIRENPYKPLSANIEKEVEITPADRASERAMSVEEIYAAAEELLKAGKELDYVAARTRLPHSEIQLLSRMLEQEKFVPGPVEEEEKPATAADKDSRLGVLGGIKRQVQVV